MDEMEIAAAIVAEVEETAGPTLSDPRMDDLDRRIRELEAAIGALRTVAAASTSLETARAGAGRHG